MSIQALREQRAAKARTLNEFVNRPDYNPATDNAVYDAGIAELEGIDGQITRIQDANERLVEENQLEGVIDAAHRVAKDQRSEGSRLFAEYLRKGVEGASAEDRQKILNTMSVGTSSQGGYTVQSEVAAQLIDSLKAYGGMRAVSDVFATAMGNPLSYPTSDGTSETGELIGENTTATAADPSFGTVALPVYKFSSKIVAVPFELLQDSQIDIEAFVMNRLRTRLGRATNTYFTTGTGSSQPNGVVTAATTGVTAANSTSQVTAVIYDSLINLQHSVDPAYRQLGNCGWMFNDQTLREIRKMKDSQNRPIFVPGYEVGVPGGMPDTLLGSPITINQDVAVMAASAKSILFGDFSFYKIRDVMDVTMFRFTDSAYAKLGQVAFLAWMRSGGNLVDTGAVKLFVNAAS
ncbi:MAG: phage major capsid protein [Caulobacteraceae bacterium]|nr:phage major capsid protein [Caulobacteraceae bacterium]